jgi:hypothetical protein
VSRWTPDVRRDEDDPPDDVQRYVLKSACLACNREIHWPACDLCCRIEYAERSVTGRASPELEEAPRAR